MSTTPKVLVSVILILAFAVDSHSFFAHAAGGLVAAYNFDEGSGTTLTDRSGSLSTGTLLNGPTWVPGKNGGALAFDGVNDSVTIPDAASLNFGTGDFTISYWAYHPTVSGAPELGKFPATGNGWRTYPSPSGRLSVGFQGSGEDYSDPAVIVANQWQYITVIRTSGVMKLYRNGVDVTSYAPNPGNLTNSVPLQIGTAGVSQPYSNFKIDDLRLYSRALSVAEIQSDMNTPVSNGGPGVPTVTLSASPTTVYIGDPATLTYSSTDATSCSGTNFVATSTSGSVVVSPSVTTTYGLTCDGVAGSASTTQTVIVSTTPPDRTPPSVPSLSGSAASASRIDLSWSTSTDDVGVAGYVLYRGALVLATTTGTTFSDQGLFASTTYAYYVKAFDAAGNVSALSTTAYVTTQAGSSGDPIGSMAPGTWLEVASSTMRSVDPCPLKTCDYSGYLGQLAVVSSWNSAVFDTSRNRLVVWGGGHNDYGGNEVYAFDINTLTWSRLTQPTTGSVGGVTLLTPTGGIYGDGTPAAKHTYDGLVYLPTLDKMFAAGGFHYRDGYSDEYTWLFNLANNTWEQVATNLATAQAGDVTDYDPVTGHVFEINSSIYALQEFDPATNTWTSKGSQNLTDYHSAGAIDPVDRLLVAIGNGYIDVVDLATGAVTHPTTTGDKTILTERSEYPGIVWNTAINQFVVWSGGANIYTLDPHTWNWTLYAPAAGNTVTPTSADPNGTYGRFSYIPSKNAYIVVNSVDQNVYIYRPSFGAPPPPPPPPPLDTTPPSVPANVLAAAVSPSQVNLSWSASTDNIGVAGYIVYRDASAIATTTALTYADTGLTASTTYAYTVSAYDAAGNVSAQSASSTATTLDSPDTTAPSIPQDVVAVATSSSQINLSWSASTDTVGVVGYKVYRGASQVATSTGTFYQDMGLLASTTYSYTVSAFDGVGNESATSSVAVATTLTPPDTTAPVLSGVSASNVGTSTATIVWNTNEPADTQVAYGTTTAYGLVSSLNSSLVLGHSQSLNGLSASTTYHYRVFSKDAAGNLATSSDATFKTQSLPDTQAPTTPTGVSATAASTTQVSLAWNTSTDNVAVTGYKVYRGLLQVATTSSVTYQDTGLTASTTYTYTVSAFDAAGNVSAKSASTTATTFATSSPFLIAAYGFNEGSGSTLLDLSGNGNTGTLVGSPLWVNGKYGKALQFNGSSNYVNLGTGSATNGLAAFTVSAWVNTTSTAEKHVLDKSTCNGGKNDGPFELGVNFFTTGKASFVVYKNGGSPNLYSVTSSASVNNGAWHHIVGTYDGATLKIYVDGVLSGTKSATGLLSSTATPLRVAGGSCTNTSYRFSGTIDDIRIYKKALTAAEVTADMNTSL